MWILLLNCNRTSPLRMDGGGNDFWTHLSFQQYFYFFYLSPLIILIHHSYIIFITHISFIPISILRCIWGFGCSKIIFFVYIYVCEYIGWASYHHWTMRYFFRCLSRTLIKKKRTSSLRTDVKNKIKN